MINYHRINNDWTPWCLECLDWDQVLLLLWCIRWLTDWSIEIFISNYRDLTLQFLIRWDYSIIWHFISCEIRFVLFQLEKLEASLCIFSCPLCQLKITDKYPLPTVGVRKNVDYLFGHAFFCIKKYTKNFFRYFLGLSTFNQQV